MGYIFILNIRERNKKKTKKKDDVLLLLLFYLNKVGRLVSVEIQHGFISEK
jgi:hypothetical protein